MGAGRGRQRSTELPAAAAGSHKMAARRPFCRCGFAGGEGRSDIEWGNEKQMDKKERKRIKKKKIKKKSKKKKRRSWESFQELRMGAVMLCPGKAEWS